MSLFSKHRSKSIFEEMEVDCFKYETAERMKEYIKFRLETPDAMNIMKDSSKISSSLFVQQRIQKYMKSSAFPTFKMPNDITENIELEKFENDFIQAVTPNVPKASGKKCNNHMAHVVGFRELYKKRQRVKLLKQLEKESNDEVIHPPITALGGKAKNVTIKTKALDKTVAPSNTVATTSTPTAEQKSKKMESKKKNQSEIKEDTSHKPKSKKKRKSKKKFEKFFEIFKRKKESEEDESDEDHMALIVLRTTQMAEADDIPWEGQVEANWMSLSETNSELAENYAILEKPRKNW